MRNILRRSVFDAGEMGLVIGSGKEIQLENTRDDWWVSYLQSRIFLF
jgi:hypothetical protein